MDRSAKRHYFDQIAVVWDDLPQPDEARVKISRFLERALPRRPRWVLDVGCGTGILAEALLKTCPSETRIVELDFAWQMLMVNAARHRHSRLLRVCADTLELPFAAGQFDAILCFNVLPHLGEPCPALAPLRAALAPAGRFAVGHLMSSEELNAFHAQLEAPVCRDRLVRASELAVQIEQAGLAVLCAEEEPGWYFLLARKAGREG